MGKVIPISKSKSDVGNYRSTSLSKYWREKKDILFENQYGFRQKHSTTDAKVGQMATGQRVINKVGEWTNAHQEKYKTEQKFVFHLFRFPFQ